MKEEMKVPVNDQVRIAKLLDRAQELNFIPDTVDAHQKLFEEIIQWNEETLGSFERLLERMVAVVVVKIVQRNIDESELPKILTLDTYVGKPVEAVHCERSGRYEVDDNIIDVHKDDMYIVKMDDESYSIRNGQLFRQTHDLCILGKF